MIRSYCFDTEKDWDEGIHLLLFAVRESVQESLGFSPFELVFGHTVRGPLKLMKEKFLSSNDSPLNFSKPASNFVLLIVPSRYFCGGSFCFMSWCIKFFVLLAPYVCFHIFS